PVAHAGPKTDDRDRSIAAFQHDLLNRAPIDPPELPLLHRVPPAHPSHPPPRQLPRAEQSGRSYVSGSALTRSLNKVNEIPIFILIQQDSRLSEFGQITAPVAKRSTRGATFRPLP